MKNKISYLAGIFDVRGFINYRPENYVINISFNFYSTEKKLWNDIKNILEEFINVKIYQSKIRKKEFQLYIGKKNNVYTFLYTIFPYSLRKDEISTILSKLKK